MVEAFKVTGGKEISGVLEVEGAKNAALPIMIATLIEKGTYILKNVPNLMDIRTLVKLLESLGLKIEKLDNHTYKIVNEGLTNLVAGYELKKNESIIFSNGSYVSS